MTIQIAPSILSADFCNLERDLKAISNADLVHVDVMDHHFVPNLTLGEPIVARICQVTDLPVDVHLMIEDPDRWAPEYAKLGAASVSFHMGATHAPVRLARQLRDMGCKACFAVRPAEPVEPIFDILDEFDMVLIMTVEPGFGGQKFLDNQMAKVRRLRDEITRWWRAPQDRPYRCRSRCRCAGRRFRRVRCRETGRGYRLHPREGRSSLQGVNAHHTRKHTNMKTFESLFTELSEKAATKQAGSLTVDELAKGTHFIGKKIVEEAGETWIAAEYEGADRTAEEMSQLIYHLQVMMIDRGITLEDIYKNL